MLTAKRIGVLMGGTSAEREVSLRSGGAILAALKGLGYDVKAVDAGPDICQMLIREKIELAFLALHGGWGEDGSIQGLLEVMGIPYTGSGVLSSALAMDKVASKALFASSGIPVPGFKVIRGLTGEWMEMPAGMEMPVVVKPQSEGSSIGVSIVREKDGLGEALRTALSFSGTAVIEQYISGKEVQIGIIEGRVLGGVEVRPSLEFYNYEAKYTPGMTQYIIPPEIDKAVYESAREIALRAHMSLGCSGATRVDLIISENGRPYVLEVNTIPGMTETSLLPKIAAHAGLSFPALVEEMLRGVAG
ncbi:MAG: D-alanine--D-alanine ligase [Thermodesulfovibrionales bacterium]|nr:D-alanine--D-alanine ligase [Thermodesulfovibrionales bacterium]